MIISIINKKGGVGKTPFAFSIAKDFGMYLQSNDNSIIESIYKNKSRISKVPQLLDHCVYDFGGFVERGVLDIIVKSDFVIVPCISSYNSILRTIETVDEIQQYNKNIIVLISDFRDDKEKDITLKALQNKLTNVDFFYFKHSRIVENSMKFGKTFTELYHANPLGKINYSKFYEEYQNLLKHIN